MASLEEGINRSYNNRIFKGDPLAIIYNEGTWRVYKVTPFLNLEYKQTKLKSYASKVKQALVVAVQDSATNYKVVFEELPHLKYNEGDANALLITVASSGNNKNEGKVYTAILMSWGMTVQVEGVTHLPYMLERGELKIGNTVKTSLRQLFDCNIWQLQLNQFKLLQFAFSFVECNMAKETDPFILVYKTPNAEKEKLTFSFHTGDIATIWDGVKEELSTLSEQVKLGYQLLQNHIFESLKFDIIACNVCEVKTLKAEIKHNGAVKMKTPETINCVLSLLNDSIGVYDPGLLLEEE